MQQGLHDFCGLRAVGQGLADALLHDVFLDAQVAFAVGEGRVAPVEHLYAFGNEGIRAFALPEIGEQPVAQIKNPRASVAGHVG